MRRFLPALLGAVLWTGGCGHVGDPLAPRANVPGKITDLAAVQRGPILYAQFSVPPRTTEGIAITEPLQLELRAGPGIEPFDLQKWAAQATRFTPKSAENGLAAFELPAAPWAGREVLLAARAVGINGKDSGWSPLITLSIVPEPAKPQDLKAQETAQGVQLTWTAAPGDFRIYRQGPGDKGFSRITDVQQTTWTDTAIEFGKPYVYLVQRIVKLADGREAESDASSRWSITPKDTFPPAAPTGLHASLAPASIEIVWQANTEPDLSGYRLYRSVNGGGFERIAEVSQIPAYSDHAVEPGKTYRYAVSAFDQSNNESERSAPFELTMQ